MRYPTSSISKPRKRSIMAGSTTPYGDVNNPDHTNINNVIKAPSLGMRASLFRKKFIRRAERIHSRIPAIKKIPLSAIGIIALIALINMLVWAVCGVVLVCLLFIEHEMRTNMIFLALLSVGYTLTMIHEVQWTSLIP